MNPIKQYLNKELREVFPLFIDGINVIECDSHTKHPFRKFIFDTINTPRCQNLDIFKYKYHKYIIQPILENENTNGNKF